MTAEHVINKAADALMDCVDELDAFKPDNRQVIEQAEKALKICDEYLAWIGVGICNK